MKKFTVIICALAVSTAAFAAPFARAIKSTKPVNFQKVEAQFDANAIQKQVKAGVDTLQVPYRSYETTYRVGKPSDGFSYDFYQQGLVSPYYESIIFVNDSLYSADWTLGDEKIGRGVKYVEVPLEFGYNELPLLKIEDIRSTYVFPWQVAKTYVEQYWEGVDGFFTAINVAPAEYTPITQCARYTEDTRESEYGSDCYQVGAGSYGNYAYGTNLKNPWQGSTTMDSIIVWFENPSVMNIDHMTAAIFTNGGSPAAMFPGEDDHVRLTVFPSGINEEGYLEVDWENPIASVIANADNFTPVVYNGTTYSYGLIEWDFIEEDPVTGGSAPAPIVVEGDFVVLLDEYNDGTANFGFFSDYYANGTYCRTYFPWTDFSEGKHYTSSVWGNNIMLNAVAYFPVFNAPEEVAFADGETEKEFTIASNVWEDDIEWEADEWIDVTIETSYEKETYQGEDYYTHNYTNKLVITVEESDEAREGVIELNAFGLPVTISVKQNMSTAVDNVTIKNNGKTYNVLGIEVSDDYKGVVIRNGEKFVR